MDERLSEELGRELVRLAMGDEINDNTLKILKPAEPRIWESVVRNLRVHGVLPLIAYSLRKLGLDHAVPEPIFASLQNTYRDTSLVNRVYLNCLGEVLELLRTRGIEPMLWKGCILADSVWPDAGTRPMGDLDLFIDPSEKAVAVEALVSAGFQPGPAMYTNSTGISVDLQHLEFRYPKGASEKSDLNTMVRTLSPRFIPTSSICCLEPTAMLARLACHLARHSGDGASMGISLRWLLDLHFVLRQWSNNIDVARLVSLTDTDIGLSMMMRAVGFFCGEMGMTYSGTEKLKSLSAQFEPLSFGEILHSRRLGVWHLPTSETGWLLFVAHHLRMRPQPGLMQPFPSDFVQIPKDWLRDNRMRRQAAMIRKSVM